MEIPFVGGAYTGRSTDLNAQTCINFFPVVDKQDAKSILSLSGTPGLTLFSSVESGVGLCVRGALVCGDYLYAVVNSRVYSVTLTGVATLLGTITTSSGYVSMASNGIQLIIVDGSSTGYIVTLATRTLTAITDPDFPAASSVTFLDGYFIVVAKGTGRIYISSAYDGFTWDALDFATAEGSPDDAIAVMSGTNDLWIFGEQTIEVFYDSGNADFPFERISGAFVGVGLGAIGSLTKITGIMFWLTDKWQVARNVGYQSQVISTPNIDYRIAQYSVVDDAVGYTYTLDGHTFYVIAFPTAGKTLVYDLTTGFWHEWESYHSLYTPWGRHRSNCCTQFGRYWIVGDYTLGKLYKLDMDVYTDNLNQIRRQRATQTINKERHNLIFHSLEIDFEAGVGLSGGVQGEDPQAVLEWSDDEGNTWSNQHWTSMGKIGEYNCRAIWRRLGMSRNRIFRLTVSDPVKCTVLSAFAEIEECRV